MSERRPDQYQMMQFEHMLKKLEEMAQPIRNDHRQREYCEYCNIVLAEFGDERTMLVGSTTERTKLRSNRNEGDFDYLAISGYTIPAEFLEYREDVPCFVHIKGEALVEKIHVQLIENKYLPASLLLEHSPLVFTMLKSILQMVSVCSTFKSREHFHTVFTKRSKVGLQMTSYEGLACDELSSCKIPEKDTMAIAADLFDKITQSTTLKENSAESVVTLFGHIVDLLHNVKSKETEDSRTYQEWGHIFKAWANENLSNKLSRTVVAEVDLQNPITPDDNASAMPADGYFSSSDEGEDLDYCNNLEEACRKEETGDEGTPSMLERDITATYSSLRDRDLVAVFPLSGRPKGIENWYKRSRYWPSQDVVDEIYNSQFFLAAKEAIVCPETEKDFCLSCNPGEIKLALAMNPVQRQCILAIKAFQRDVLEEYTQVLTSYHWKTAAYRKFEALPPSTWVQSNTLPALKIILKFMVDCLHGGQQGGPYLEHFFVKSNLLAGIKENDAKILINKISGIHENPIAALRGFFTRERTREFEHKTVAMPATTAKQLQRRVSDPRDKLGVDTIESVLLHFARALPTGIDCGGEEVLAAMREPSVQEAMLKLAPLVLKDIARENKYQATKYRFQAPSTVSIANILSSLKWYLSANRSELDRKRALEDLTQKIRSFIKASGGGNKDRFKRPRNH